MVAPVRIDPSTPRLFKTKAKNVFLPSKQLVDTAASKPDTREAPKLCPGRLQDCHRCSTSLRSADHRQADTYIFRLANRLGSPPGKTPEEVEARLAALIPEPYVRYSHHWLILHGCYVCK